jgi:hypothetical protein
VYRNDTAHLKNTRVRFHSAGFSQPRLLEAHQSGSLRTGVGSTHPQTLKIQVYAHWFSAACYAGFKNFDDSLKIQFRFANSD